MAVAARPATRSHGRSVALVLGGGVMLGSAGTAAAFTPATATPAGVGGMRLLAGAAALTVMLPLVGGRWRSLPGLVRRPPVWVMGPSSSGDSRRTRSCPVASAAG